MLRVYSRCILRIAAITLTLLASIALMFLSATADAKIGTVKGSTGGLGLQLTIPYWVTVEREPCPSRPDVAGCADIENATVYSATRDRFVIWHEIGHVFDYQRLSDADRAWFTGVLGFARATPWFSDRDDVVEVPAEFFADAYAACALRRSPTGERRGRALVDNWPIGYGYRPTVRQHRRICNAIAVYDLVR